MSTPREELLQALKLVLESMTGLRPWGGSYPNAPRVELVYSPPALQNYTPYLAIIEVEGSQVTRADHDGGVDDDFRFDIYGQTAKYGTVSAREWAGRLRADCRRTIEAAALWPGDLFLAGAKWITVGPDIGGFLDNEADFSLACTARLTYVLAATH